MLVPKNTHRVIDVEESLACGKVVIWVDALQAPDSQKHSDR